MKLEEKVIAFYIKLKMDDKGPVYRMVMEEVLKDYENYFNIKLAKDK